MSMAVDLSTPLTEEERAYLASRGRYAEIERADSMHGVESPELDAGDGTGPASHETNLTFNQQARIAELERQLAELRDVTGSGTKDPEDDEELEPYETWTVAQLDAQLKARDLPVVGNKQDKVNSLYADDEKASQA